MSFVREHKEVMHSPNIWRTALRVWVYASIVVLPLFVLPFTRDVINFPKSLALYVVVVVALLLWLAMLIFSKEGVIRRTILDTALGAFLAAVLLSTLFSKALSLSVIGRVDAFTLNLFFLAASAIWMWLIIQVSDKRKHAEIATQLLLGSGVLAGFLFLARKTSVAETLFGGASLQSLSNINSIFAMIIAVLTVLGIGLLLVKGRHWSLQILPGLSAVLGTALMLYTDFTVGWVVYVVGIACVVGISVLLARHTSVPRASTAFVFLLIGISALIFSAPNAWQATLPVEVALGAEASWDIARPAWLSNVKTFFLGSGPGTFTIDFSRYRTALFNVDPLTWTTRFTLPFNTPLALLSEVGLLGLAPLVFVVLIVFGNVANALRRVHQAFRKSPQELAEACGPEYMTPFMLFATWIAATVALGAAFADVVLWLTWWLLLALLLLSLSRMLTGVIRRNDISLRISSEYTLAFSFGMILVLFGILLFGVMGYRMYAAEKLFTKVVSTRNVDQQEQLLATVLEKRPQYVEYQLGRARLHVEQARQLAATDDPDVTTVATKLSQAVEQTKAVTERHPYAIDAWELLGVIYMNSRVITADANAWALDAIERAMQLEPSNPLLYWRRANIEAYAGDTGAAEHSYIRAIELKPDYVIAYTELSDLYEQQNELGKAISVYQPIMPLVQNNADLLFRLGRLFYNRNGEGDLDRAQQVWGRGIQLVPEHSNTLYSLGLLYERLGDVSTARDYFEQVQTLNPDNEDIATKIRSL